MKSARSTATTQIKLLRVISEERAFERVGGSHTLHADVRLIAATNKNLEKLVNEGKFRDDLYFRLNVVKITMPPLRERKEDIPLLVRAFLRHFSQVNERPLLEITAEAMNTLLTYDWPGNVRELRTAIEHGVVMATGSKVSLRDLPAAVRQAAGAPLPAGITRAKAFDEKASPLDLHATERRLIMQALAATNGNITAAAKKLGISRRTLHRKINEMNAEKSETQNSKSEGNSNDENEKFKTSAAKRSHASDFAIRTCCRASTFGFRRILLRCPVAPKQCSVRCTRSNRAASRSGCDAPWWYLRDPRHRALLFHARVSRARDLAGDGPGADRP